MKSTIVSIKNAILNIIFPEKCLGCDRKDSILCPRCIGNIRRAERETDQNIIAAYDYRDPIIKKAIWDLKYHKHRHIGEKLGEMLYDTLLEEVADIRAFTCGKSICVIPVPVSRTRKKTRGYNQAEILARSFCASSSEKIFELRKDIIRKKLNTTPQARMTNRVKRLENIKGAFEILKPNLVKERTVIIIDDVTTTGGTINEIIKLLKKSGAKKVVGFALAH